MNLNLVIRTYNIENLRYSLFEVPKNIEGVDKLRIVIHNDNPGRSDECNKLVNEFKEAFSDLDVLLVNEIDNKYLLMSLFDSIPYLMEDYEWTMFIDDDDFPSIDEEVSKLLDNECSDCSKVWTKTKYYEVVDLSEDLTKIDPTYKTRAMPNFIRTKVLMLLHDKRNLFIGSLLKIYGTTKVGNTDDWVFLYALKVIEDTYYKAHGLYMNDDYDSHNPLECTSLVMRTMYHECNGYVSWQYVDKDETSKLFRRASRFRNEFLRSIRSYNHSGYRLDQF